MNINKLQLITIFLFMAGFFCPGIISAQQIEVVHEVNWLTFEQIKTLNKENPRPVVVFFYSAGNDSSKLMLQNALSRKEICAYMNGKFYAVKFDVSSKAEVNFLDDKTYKKDPTKSYHDLSTVLLGDKPKVPAMIFYDENNSGFKFSGYKNQYDLLCMLVYFGENIEKTTRYEVWAPAYFRTFPPNQASNRISLAINWMPLTEALKMNQENPKGIFITWYVKTNAASSVMLVNAFTHSRVARFMNENFYCVRLDAQTTDTLKWDKLYYNKDGKYHFHELATLLMKGQMQFPSIFFFDKQNKLILSENLYLSPEAFYLLANYVKSDAYKTQKFADFMKTFKFDWDDIVPREHPNVENKKMENEK